MTAAQAIASFAHGFTASQLTPELVTACGRALVDTYCVAIAGRNETAPELALRYARTLGTTTDGLQAQYWGDNRMLPIELAALCNGIAGHVLDYDDVTSPMRGHPSMALVPALVALAEALDSSGQDVAIAYTCGFEVICKLSHAMAVDHYARGWHSTSSIGSIAAAVACSRLLGLDTARIVHAIGLAVAQASGSRANFGTHAKSFQAGHANVCGLRAALLAKEGFDAAADALEGEFGYMNLYGKGESLDDALQELGAAPLELIRSGIEVKKYPLCYATHRALDGILDLRSERNLTLESVQSIHVRASSGAFTPLLHPRPLTGLEAKFSMQYAMAAALLDGEVGLASFTDSAVLRPQIQDFLAQVTCDDTQSGPTFPRWTELLVTLNGGEKIMRHIATLRGSAAQPLSLSELRTKASDCLAWGKAQGRVDALIDNAVRLDQIPMRQWRASAQIAFQ